jgi:hypothetical protein
MTMALRAGERLRSVAVTTVIDGALITANRLDDAGRSARGAVYDARGRLVRASVRSTDRTDRWQPSDPETTARPAPVVGRHQWDGAEWYVDEAIHAGHLFAGWGHVITESVSTAWAAPGLPGDAPVLLVPWGRLWVSALPRLVETLRLACWGERRIIVATGETHVGRLHVPDRLIRVGELLDERASIDTTMNAVYDRMAKASSSASASEHGRVPVYLDRTPDHRRAHPGEREFVAALATAGVRVIQGWTLSVREQIAEVSNASAVVAFSGSSLHNSVFADQGVPVVEIADERALRGRSRGKVGLQEPLCELRRQRFSVVPGYDALGPRDTNLILDDVLRDIAR